MIFHENCLLADDSHEISYLIFFRKLVKTSQNLLSGAVVIGALRVNQCNVSSHLSCQCNRPQPDAVSGTQTYEDLV